MLFYCFSYSSIYFSDACLPDTAHGCTATKQSQDRVLRVGKRVDLMLSISGADLIHV